jgi:hypothetical protein
MLLQAVGHLAVLTRPTPPLVHGVDEQIPHLERRQVALAKGVLVPGSDVRATGFHSTHEPRS